MRIRNSPLANNAGGRYRRVAQETGFEPNSSASSWRGGAQAVRLSSPLAGKDTHRERLPSLQIQQLQREDERHEHDRDDAPVDGGLHSQTDHVHVTRMRLEGIGFFPYSILYTGKRQCVDQRDAADVDESAGKSRERVLFDIQHERDEQEIDHTARKTVNGETKSKSPRRCRTAVRFPSGIECLYTMFVPESDHDQEQAAATLQQESTQ